MNLPILGKLRDGEKFDFATLVDNLDEAESHWEHWWENRSIDKITRPEIITDDDPVLEVTAQKKTADLCSYNYLFNDFLLNAIENKILPFKQAFSRRDFRSILLRIIGANSVKLPSAKQIIFCGGGYGSGKTTIIGKLADAGKIPFTRGHMVGVDYFKWYVPEFSLIQAVGDGRASLTVQTECKHMADELFTALVSAERSFVWDSSMSSKEEALKHVLAARAAGYEIGLVAIFTPLQIAIRQAMHRAKIWRRFPHPIALPKSHIEFRKAFPEYEKVFEEITVFAKAGKKDEDPIVIAEKKCGKALEVFDEPLFNSVSRIDDNL